MGRVNLLSHIIGLGFVLNVYKMVNGLYETVVWSRFGIVEARGLGGFGCGR